MKIILTCCLALLAFPVLAAGLPHQPHISVSGHGIVRVVPDMLTVRLSVDKLGQDIAAAKQYVDRHTAEAIEVARRLGIDQRDITSTQIYISPRYRYHQDERQLVGYDVRRQVTLTLRNLDQYEPLLEGLVKAGVNGIDGVATRYSDPAALRDRAFAEAVDDARAKATRLAQAFHAGLGQVYSIVEQSSPEPRPMMMQARAGFAAGAESSAFEPGTIDVEARIQVVFLLKPTESAGE
ncbi:MAG TPA: SIMPL domain-containing protein [Gammaproteobacteria bacterium]|nr:SIMPL domain-containing protein [Gammaproteobacteria bacterium]